MTAARSASSPTLRARCSSPNFTLSEPEQMFKVLRTQVDVVLPEGAAVLNARDPRVVEMAPLCDGEVIFFGR